MMTKCKPDDTKYKPDGTFIEWLQSGVVRKPEAG